MERVSASGCLREWLHLHLQAGGEHPAALRRSALIQAGVPLKARKLRNGRKCRAHILWANAEYAKILESRTLKGEVLPRRAEYLRIELRDTNCCLVLEHSHVPQLRLRNLLVCIW